MTEPVSIRWTCAQRVLEKLRERAALADVQIESGWPGDNLSSECVWLDSIESIGDGIDIPVSKGPDGVVARNDEFTIPLEIRVATTADRDEAMGRVAEIITEIEWAFAVDSQLEQLDGVLTASIYDEKQSGGQLRGGPFLAFGEVVIYVMAVSR